MAKKIGLFMLLASWNLTISGCSRHDAVAATLPEPSAKASSSADTRPAAEPASTAARQAAEAHACDAHCRREHDELLGKIGEAKRLLRYAAVPSRKIGGDNAVLALWKPRSNEPIRLVSIRDGVCKTRGCTASVVRPNGANSQYHVTEPADRIVIALKTNVKHPKFPKVPQQVTYVPYSPALQTEAGIRAGKKYLADLVRRGAERIDGRNVRSLADPTKRPTDTVDARILATLLVVEHVDPASFDRDGVTSEVRKVLTVLAANRGDAYRYAVSYAEARGLAQFIASTYKQTRERYPHAGLPDDFVQGMTDHENAVCAQYCLADWSVTRLNAEQMQRLRKPENVVELGAFLAAAYNGGEDKAARAMTQNPSTWEKDGQGLFPQTVKYVEIFRATYGELYGS